MLTQSPKALSQKPRGTLIFYTQNLNRPPQALQNSEVTAAGGDQRSSLGAVQTPMIVTGIPYDQPDPQVSMTLKHLALYLDGVRQVSFRR